MSDISKFRKTNRNELRERQKVGRKPKPKEKKLTEKITLSFTLEEKEKIAKRSEKQGGLPYTIMIRNVLREAGVI